MQLGRVVVWGAVVAVLAAGGYFFVRATDNSNASRTVRTLPPAPVLTARAAPADIPIRLAVIGTVQPVATVAIKSRVDGQILKTHFTEGQMVKQGDLLFTVDSRPFEWQLRQAQANLERDEALLAQAQADFARYAKLSQQDFASKQKYEQSQAQMRAATATVMAGRATIEQIKLQIEFTAIRSPIDGRTGAVLVNPGNLVKANDTNPLVVINQIQPIDVSFSIPERFLDRLRRAERTNPIAVNVFKPETDKPFATGTLIFVNNAIDTNTGTIQLKGRFENGDGMLVPGQFVNVSMTLATLRNVLAVPSEAVQVGQRGRYVFVVKADRTVERRDVRVGAAADGKIAIEAGLAAGEEVVTDGQLRLFPGARVVPRPAGGRPGAPRNGQGQVGERQ